MWRVEKVIIKTHLGMPGTIVHRSEQTLDNADDIDMIGTSEAVVADAFGSLKVEAAKMGLRTNVPKTKYMIMDIEPGGKGTVELAGDVSTSSIAAEELTSNDMSEEYRYRVMCISRALEIYVY